MLQAFLQPLNDGLSWLCGGNKTAIYTSKVVIYTGSAVLAATGWGAIPLITCIYDASSEISSAVKDAIDTAMDRNNCFDYSHYVDNAVDVGVGVAMLGLTAASVSYFNVDTFGSKSWISSVNLESTSGLTKPNSTWLGSLFSCAGKILAISQGNTEGISAIPYNELNIVEKSVQGLGVLNIAYGGWNIIKTAYNDLMGKNVLSVGDVRSILKLEQGNEYDRLKAKAQAETIVYKMRAYEKYYQNQDENKKKNLDLVFKMCLRENPFKGLHTSCIEDSKLYDKAATLEGFEIKSKIIDKIFTAREYSKVLHENGIRFDQQTRVELRKLASDRLDEDLKIFVYASEDERAAFKEVLTSPVAYEIAYEGYLNSLQQEVF